MFGKEDFTNLAEILGRIKGRFLLSINDTPEVRNIFSAFHLTEVSVSYSISASSKARGKRGELLVSNFELKAS